MKRIIKSLTAVIAYLLLLCYLLGTEAVLLLSPKHIGMFLLGCIILCIPSLDKKIRWKEFREIFQKNAIMAGYLETFVLLFASVSQRKMGEGEFLREFALSLRPVFYGFVCHLILREDLTKKNLTEDEKTDSFAGKAKEELPVLKNPRNNTSSELPSPEKANPKPDLSGLTRQEKLVAELVSRGLTNREIGEELYISETTVKKHISNIFEKTGISSRRQLR
ncbi:MAG: helix-turn-helix transcriptional regulator [Lachnospiraceae bacterium]|jgi:DNA-binding CsgD family transcriptional regulator|nr:helix-turn-helix transcriptional regulator [Lachnospiraceae bacterium]